jgi:amino acid transporter
MPIDEAELEDPRLLTLVKLVYNSLARFFHDPIAMIIGSAFFTLMLWGQHGELELLGKAWPGWLGPGSDPGARDTVIPGIPWDQEWVSFLAGVVLVVASALAGAFGINALKRVVQAGIAAEASALAGIGVILILAFREQEWSILTETLGAEALSGGSVGAGLLAALAVGGWVFIGFDACVGVAEETQRAARHVPRAVWFAVLSVAALVLLALPASRRAYV